MKISTSSCIAYSLSEDKLRHMQMIRFHSPHRIIKNRYRAASLFLVAIVTLGLSAQTQTKEKT